MNCICHPSLKWCLETRLFFKDFIYLFSEREGREKERERLMYVRGISWLPLACPQPETWPTTQACALGIEPVTFQFTGQRSVHWATPARAGNILRTQHCSCFGIEFNATGALKCVNNYHGTLEVACAEEQQKSRMEGEHSKEVIKP